MEISRITRMPAHFNSGSLFGSTLDLIATIKAERHVFVNKAIAYQYRRSKIQRNLDFLRQFHDQPSGLINKGS